MALTKCPECQTEISDKAANCPKCAYPLAGGTAPIAPQGKVQTVEQTGKKFKLQIILSSLLLSIGIFLVVFNMASGNPNESTISMGMVTAVIGLFWLAIVKFIAWWQHG